MSVRTTFDRVFSAGRLRVLLAMTALSAAAASAPAQEWFAGESSALSPLAAAHAAYLERDFTAMSRHVREALATDGLDAVEQRNLLDLVDRAYVEAKGELPADWQLPAPLSNLKFKHFYKELPEGREYAWALAVTGPERDTVRSLRLVKFPDQVILDHAAGVGEWTAEADDGQYYFELYGGDGGSPLAEGLYLFRIDLADGRSFDGWFPLSRHVATAAPEVTSPEVGQVYDQGNPEIRWADFRSPEYRPGERRIASIGVGRLSGPDHVWTGVWSHVEADPTLTSVVVGRTPDSDGVDLLPDGGYWLSVTYFEQRAFGDLRLRRGARTVRPFRVATRP